MKSVEVDRGKRLKEEPAKGHNRWHPDITPVIEVDPGEEVVLETRDASDCQVKPAMTVEDLDGLDTKVAHPLTGPVYIKGAAPGDSASRASIQRAFLIRPLHLRSRC